MTNTTLQVERVVLVPGLLLITELRKVVAIGAVAPNFILI